MNTTRIMFVCSGNICRSPLAHRMLEHQAAERGLAERIAVESSGTGAWHVGQNADPRMRKTAARHGLHLDHPAQQLERQDLVTFDLIFAMDHGHYREIGAMARHTPGAAPELDGRLFLFRQFDPACAPPDGIASLTDAPDVPDPYYGGAEGFEEVYRMVDRTCHRILDLIERGAFP